MGFTPTSEGSPAGAVVAGPSRTSPDMPNPIYGPNPNPYANACAPPPEGFDTAALQHALPPASAPGASGPETEAPRPTADFISFGAASQPQPQPKPPSGAETPDALYAVASVRGDAGDAHSSDPLPSHGGFMPFSAAYKKPRPFGLGGEACIAATGTSGTAPAAAGPSLHTWRPGVARADAPGEPKPTPPKP